VRVEDGIREGMMAGTEDPDQAGVVVVGCARSRSNGQRERVSHLKLVVRPPSGSPIDTAWRECSSQPNHAGRCVV
jgi:hypothetical protein